MMAAVDADLVKYEVIDHTALIVMQHRARMNSLGEALRVELLRAYQRAEGDSAVRALILTGYDDVFSAGGSIDEFDLSPEGVDRLLEAMMPFLTQAERVSKPVVAAVNGVALGGGFELALSCDLIVAAENASFGLPEPKVGLVPLYAMVRLERVLGKFAANEILLTAASISAAKAASLGIVSRVVAPADLISAALELSHDIARLGPLALKLVKRLVNRNWGGADLSFAVEATRWLLTTEDAREGVEAFLKKRPPTFHGR